MTLPLECVPHSRVTNWLWGTHSRGKFKTLDGRRQTIDRILGAIKYLDPVQRQSLVVDRIAERAGGTFPDNLMMRSEQVSALLRISANVTGHFGNVTDLGLSAGLRG